MKSPNLIERSAPGSPWGKPCAVCGEPEIQILCAACRAPVHSRCLVAHLDQQCLEPNVRHLVALRDCIECGKPWRPPEIEPGRLVCPGCVSAGRHADKADGMEISRG